MFAINITLLVLSFAAMEWVAWATHKYLMHGWLWHLHRDHHTNENEGFFQRNDFFFLVFAIPGFLCILFGVQHGVLDPRLWIGTGITLYGLAYLLVHEIFIHQRVRLFTRTNNAYLRAVRKAHKIHHNHLSKEEGECFGMLWVPRQYWPAERQRIS